FALPPGWWAAALALPWLGVTAAVAMAGLVRIRGRRFSDSAGPCGDAGLVYLVVGGGWTVLSRAGMRPLEFEDVIVLLTGIHFHYAGFALPVLTSLASRRLPGRNGTLAARGVATGVPLVGVG